MYAEKLFRHYKKDTKDMQLILKPCPLSISKSYLKQQKKQGLSEVVFTNEALLLAANLFLTQSNLNDLSACKNTQGQLDHIDLLNNSINTGVRITKDGLFISNQKPEFKYVTSYVYCMASHGWLLNHLITNFASLGWSKQNTDYSNQKLGFSSQSDHGTSAGLINQLPS